MKVVRNGVCYVDFLDIVRYPTPSYLVFDKVIYEKGEFVTFKDQMCIDYIMGRSDILDYDEVASISPEELEAKYQDAKKRLNAKAKRILETPLERQHIIYRDREFMNGYNDLKHRTADLGYYKEHKDEVDKRMSSLSKTTQKHLGKVRRDNKRVAV